MKLTTDQIFTITENTLLDLLTAQDELAALEADQDQIAAIQEMIGQAIARLFRLQAATRPQPSNR